VNCPRCQHDNPAGVKFCGECGARLETACPACGAVNPPGNKFCGQCGAALVQAVTSTKFASPEIYTPKHLAEKILTSKSALEGERKQVTVLFADLKGSMELLAERDPEEARKLFDAVIEQMMEAVHRYEGTVNHILGDGIMALFGAPLAHEDHAVRACYAALRMQESVKRYALEVQRSHGIPIQIRVGLNSGEVVVGSIKNDLHMDYTAIGQTAHLAARMEQMAMPGTIMITADALRLAEGYVQVKPLGPVNVKGLNEPVEVYEITGAGPVRSRLKAAAERGLTRFVGRNAELETLRLALDKAASGHGQVLALVGEPGVGKSRLFWEFTHSRRTANWLILDSGSVSYGRASAYLPIIDLLKAYFRIEERDDVRNIREKVTGKLLTLDRTLEPTLSAFLALLGAPIEDQRWQNLDPAQRRQRTLDAVKRLLLRESQVQPLLVMLEDLHWIDSESQSLLDSLIESLPTARLLLLMNYRPEYQHGWGSKTYYSQLRIDPLPPESAGELLEALLGNQINLQPVKQLLIRRTEGNPFFLEETVRTLVETKVLTGERGNYTLAKPIGSTQLPATVQAILAARIDRLTPEEKRLLQSAAVIGKDVPFTLLQAIADQSDEELRRRVAHLQAAEFLYETSLFPDLEYTFKHALTHEVAYGSLLQERRRAIHGRIVEVLESVYSGRSDEQAEHLAHHAVRGAEWGKAVTYLHQAGRKAAARSANLEAIHYFQQALEALEHLPEDRQIIEQAIAIRIDLGPALRTIKRASAPEVEQTYTQAQELCQRLGDTPQLFPVLWGLCRVYHSRGELHKARELGEQLFSLALRMKDPALILEAHHTQWSTFFSLGELRYAREHFEQGHALYDPRRHRQHAFLYAGHDPGVCCGTHAARTLWLQGYPDQALGKSQDALGLARELSHPFSLAFALLWAAIVHHHRGEWRAVEERVGEGLTLATEQGFPRWMALGNFLRGRLMVEHGQVEEGIAQLRQGLAARATVEEQQPFVTYLAHAYGEAGEAQAGLSVVAEALAIARKNGSRPYEAELHRVKGELLLRQKVPDAEEAQACFQKAVEVARSQEAKSLELRAVMSLSRLWQSQGKKDEARQALADIYDWFTEGFDTSDLKSAKALLEELS
jgi:class 3 adenylate cyclase/predicted ATPase